MKLPDGTFVPSVPEGGVTSCNTPHWLAGKTPEEIANISYMTRRQIHNIIESGKASKRETLSIIEQPPIYNVWNYGNCDPSFTPSLNWAISPS